VAVVFVVIPDNRIDAPKLVFRYEDMIIEKLGELAEYLIFNLCLSYVN